MRLIFPGLGSKKDKKGWLKIIEAFIAMMLITIVLLNVVYDRTSFLTDDLEDSVYEAYRQEQISILRKIQLDNSLRSKVLSSDLDVPLRGEDIPESIKAEIEKNTPDYLNCTANICYIQGECSLSEDRKGNIFVEEASIFSNYTHYNPRKLKLFCWEK